jgi:hypothetical protein
MVSVDSRRVSRAPRYSGVRFESGSLSPTWLSHSVAPLSRGLRLTTGLVTLLLRILQPLLHLTSQFQVSCFETRPKLETRNCLIRCNRFGLFRFRSPLLSESRLLSFPPGTEMVHFPGCARARLWIQRTVRRFYHRGFPHSEIPGSKPACGSPRLIAACHVLLRLLLPRHPPCALSSLTIKFTQRMRAYARSISNLMGLSAHRAWLIYSSRRTPADS